MSELKQKNAEGKNLEAEGVSWVPYKKMARQPRAKPMQVLCLGLSRSGTMSTYAALNQLGYNSYHFAEAGIDTANDSLRKWRSAIDAKYNGGTGKRLTTAEDFDEMLWRYDAVTDIPCALFADELINAYPDAKVVLNERDVDGWGTSVFNTFHAIMSLKRFKILEYIDFEYTIPAWSIFRTALNIWSDNDPNNREAFRKGYARHNGHIKSIVPAERLLVFHPRQGWEPLCKHIGKPVPSKPFPKINEGSTTFEFFAGLFWKIRYMVVALKALKTVAPFIVVWLAVWVYRSGVLEW